MISNSETWNVCANAATRPICYSLRTITDMNCIEERAKSKEFLYRFLFYLEAREVCDCKCVSSIIRLWNFSESEYHFESFLDLGLFSKSIPCYSCLHLEWSILDEWYPTSGERIDDHPTSLSDIDTVRDIAKKKQTLNPANRRTICIEYFTEISPDLHESIRECYTRASGDHSILEYCHPFSLLLEDSESGGSGSWIYSEDYHEGIISKKWRKSYRIGIFNWLNCFLKYYIFMWIVCSDPYEAISENPISTSELLRIATTVIQEILQTTPEDSLSIIKPNFNDIFWNQEIWDILALNTLGKKFNRDTFLEQNPNIRVSSLDGFCFRFRAEVALILYPDRIQNMIQYLQEKKTHDWRPNDLMKPLEKGWDRALSNWIARNIRTKDGKTDWWRFSQAINQSYPSTLIYTEKRDPFTQETAIELCRNIAQWLVDTIWYWNPEWITNKDGEVYSYITSLSQFRRTHDRPDLEMRSKKTWIQFDPEKLISRPNWFAIAEEMWEIFVATMQLWNHRWGKIEQELRTMKLAYEELEYTVRELQKEWKHTWKPRDIQIRNQALYRWFQLHSPIDTDRLIINWGKILSELELSIRESFQHSV